MSEQMMICKNAEPGKCNPKCPHLHKHICSDSDCVPYTEPTPESKPCFANARVGDKVTHSYFGNGEISSIQPFSNYPIVVLFKGFERKTYTLQGQETTGGKQTLFWVGTTFEVHEAPEPKRMKKITQWVTLFPKGKAFHLPTESEALGMLRFDNPPIVKPFPVEIEVPEDMEI
jgi:hypothetical protein